MTHKKCSEIAVGQVGGLGKKILFIGTERKFSHFVQGNEDKISFFPLCKKKSDAVGTQSARDTMNACRRIHSLRAHRQKPNGNRSENWHSASGFKYQHGDDLVTVHTLYTVIIMILLGALWGAWSRKDSSL